jgi:lauroyl/myristoyl acyltransferase
VIEVGRPRDGVALVTLNRPEVLNALDSHAVGELTRAIEEDVRKYPDQWVWMHARWHTQRGTIR